MKRIYFRLLVVFLGTALLSAAAFATDSDHVIVNIPYDFVAGGQTLPAGTYTVQRLSTTALFPLFISNRENHTGIYVFANEVETASANPSLTFVVAGDEHFLTRIQTAQHSFSFKVSASVIERSANSRSYLTGTSESSRH